MARTRSAPSNSGLIRAIEQRENAMMNEKNALDHLMGLLAIPGLSGREKNVSMDIQRRLKAVGVKPSWMMIDQANKKIPGDFETGNLIVKLPGTIKGPRVLFSSHMDTVPLTRGAVPTIKGKRIVPKGPTALGGDNRTAVACLVTLAETLLTKNIPHPPITLLFTVGEEIGLWGARFVKPKDLGNPVMGFNYDSGDPALIEIGAIGAHRWDVSIQGVASHAGVHPEHGVSAILIASQAIAEIKAKGYFGKIRIKGKKGTSNVGVIQGGEATNEVTGKLFLKGESRSHDPEFLEEITGTIEACFHRAASRVKNHKKVTGKITWHCEKDYHAFKIDRNEPCVKIACKAAKTIGYKPRCAVIDGGLDANYLNAHGIPTVTLGAGQHNPHTLDEYVDLKEYYDGCRLALEVCKELVG
ncbi:MAG: tripeptide aminopeptidase [Candidatus Omnitrophota bacterium]